VLVTDEVFKAWLSTSVDMLDYDNFKNRVWDTRGDEFHDALAAVWSAMYKLQQ
jgi:GGDEF domain-containing protein